MKKQFEIYNGDCKVTYDDSEVNNALVVEKIIEFCKRYNVSCGESACQSDDPQIESVYLLVDIIDNVLNFETQWRQE